MKKHSNKIEFIEAFKKRTQIFTLDVIKLFQKLPRTEEAKIIGRQFLRSGTSAGANYRAVCRARSPKEQFSKLSITVEEADETLFWIEILRTAEIVSADLIAPLEKEATEILSVLATARKNSK